MTLTTHCFLVQIGKKGWNYDSREGAVVLVHSFHLLWLSLGIHEVQEWVRHVCQIFICRTFYFFFLKTLDSI
jgi:hypothetical protein